ncbi:MAG: hypothetical protein JXR80_10780 [Deltaproteobacteria bacterium]|nr:hypothetical protein [Deltaproteobacteria bacterium]
MQRVHIIGCGKFGYRALTFYAREKASPSLVLVDADAANLLAGGKLLSSAGVKFTTSALDAVTYLTALLAEAEARQQDWIIPTVPLHLAFAVLSRITRRPALAWTTLPPLPNLFTGERDELYSSLADFLCPADCPQPRTHCFHTGKKRNPSLLNLLARLEYRLGVDSELKLPSFILPSTQIGPGLGGFPLRRLARLITFINERRPEPLLFSTACRCHGVTNILGRQSAV